MRLIASDYDGTIEVKKQIAPSTIDAIAKFRGEENIFGIITGRDIHYAVWRFAKFIDHIDFIIANNGGTCFAVKGAALDRRMKELKQAQKTRNDENVDETNINDIDTESESNSTEGCSTFDRLVPIYAHTIPSAEAVKICELKDMNLCRHVCLVNSTGRLLIDYPEEYNATVDWNSMEHMYSTFPHTRIPLSEVGQHGPYTQIDAYFKSMEYAYATQPQVRAASSAAEPNNSDVCLDINPTGVNKAFGVSQLIEYIEKECLFPLESTKNGSKAITVGDGLNDLPMLKAFTSFAVAHGHPEALGAAGSIVDSVDEMLLALPTLY